MTAQILVNCAGARDGLGSYIRGTLALHGIDENRVDLCTWIDCIYAVLVNAPGEVIESVDKKLILTSAKIAPDRSTWGALPEHQRLAPKMRRPASGGPVKAGT